MMEFDRSRWAAFQERAKDGDFAGFPLGFKRELMRALTLDTYPGGERLYDFLMNEPHTRGYQELMNSFERLAELLPEVPRVPPAAYPYRFPVPEHDGVWVELRDEPYKGQFQIIGICISCPGDEDTLAFMPDNDASALLAALRVAHIKLMEKWGRSEVPPLDARLLEIAAHVRNIQAHVKPAGACNHIAPRIDDILRILAEIEPHTIKQKGVK